jgi:hypothetical protein
MKCLIIKNENSTLQAVLLIKEKNYLIISLKIHLLLAKIKLIIIVVNISLIVNTNRKTAAFSSYDCQSYASSWYSRKSGIY